MVLFMVGVLVVFSFASAILSIPFVKVHSVPTKIDFSHSIKILSIWDDDVKGNGELLLYIFHLNVWR